MAQVPNVDVEFDGDGVTSILDFDFPYQQKDEIFVTVDGVVTPYSWVVGSTHSIQVLPAPAVGTRVRIYRSTKAYTPLHVFDAGVPFLPRYVDENNRQLLYVVQEGVDTANAAETIAVGIAGVADNALAAASQATVVANNALVMAEGIADTANSAFAASAQATQTADTALAVAGGVDAKATAALAVADGADATATAALTASAQATTAVAQRLPLTGGTLTGAVNYAPAATVGSAATVDLGSVGANTVNITGNATITSFGTIAAGAQRTLVFGGTLTLTHSATKLILPGAANIVTAVGDVAGFESLGAGNWKCVGYVRANGRALVTDASSLAWGGIGGVLANQADLQAALDAKLNNSDVGYAYIYPNGTQAAPYSMPTNTRLTATNPFPGSPVIAQVEIQIAGVWAEPGWDGNTGSGALSYGVRAGQIAASDLIVVQSGTGGVGFALGAYTGGLHGGSSTATIASAPIRVKVFKGRGTL